MYRKAENQVLASNLHGVEICETVLKDSPNPRNPITLSGIKMSRDRPNEDVILIKTGPSDASIEWSTFNDIMYRRLLQLFPDKLTRKGSYESTYFEVDARELSFAGVAEKLAEGVIVDKAGGERFVAAAECADRHARAVANDEEVVAGWDIFVDREQWEGVIAGAQREWREHLAIFNRKPTGNSRE